MKRFFIFFAILFVGALGFGVFLGMQSQDLDDITGRNEEDRESNPVNVPALIETAAKTRTDVTITERQLNTWLADTLKARQDGLLSDFVQIKGVWVRFDEEEGGRAEIIIERDIQGFPQTISMFVRIERRKKEDGKFYTYIHKDGGRIWGILAAGGRFGKARVPQGFLYLTRDSFESLAELFEVELGWMQTEIASQGAGRIIFEEDQMRISFPRD